MQRRHFIAAGAAGLMAPAWAASEAYPARPVRLIVPFPPGGPTDVMGRAAAKALGERLSQPFVVDNRAGAGGNIGTDAVAKAAPDGYTLGLSAISSLAIAPHLYARLPFQVDKDLAPISQVGISPCVVVAHPSVPFNDLKGLVAYAKANPGKLHYGTSGVGTSNHLAAELLQSTAGIQLANVPYKGSSQIVPDLLAGALPMSMESSLATTLPHIKAGKLKALAVTTAQRAQALPDVPTVAESGYPGFEVQTWFGLVAPAATPAAIVDKLSATWRACAAQPGTMQAFAAISADVRADTPQAFAQFIRAESERWGALIRRLGLKAD